MTTEPINLYDYETLAYQHLAKDEADAIEGGATDEITLRRTRAVFDSIMLRPRMLVDIDHVDPRTTVLGQPIEFPVMLDPLAGMAGPILMLSWPPPGRRARWAPR